MYIGKVCELLGIREGEAFLSNDSWVYKVLDGDLYIKDKSENWTFYNDGWVKFIKGEVKPIWKPEIGETFYFIGIDGEIFDDINYDGYYEKSTIEFGNCFKTKEEAQEVSKYVKELLWNKKGLVNKGE